MKRSIRAEVRKRKETKHRYSLTLVFAFIVFTITLIAIGVSMGLTSLLLYLGFGDENGELSLGTIFLFLSAFSVLLGAILAFFSSRIPLKPVNLLINKMNGLAAGKFKTRLEFKGAVASHPAFKEISDSFNKMAEELEGTEMLRSDFINNFSHEFKTPIVSIAGLAKLVNKGGLEEEEREQYLRAIEEESLRLSYMATNVLNLTRLENQTILSNLTVFNLSEQIRSSVLLLENKWTKNDIDFNLDIDEYMLEGNEEQLKQVWINLIDNAIKFSERSGTVYIDVERIDKENMLSVRIKNIGSEISPETMEKIFNKFYQADESHATEGNGIGLAIVKRVVELHGGAVSAKSENGATEFLVELPIKH